MTADEATRATWYAMMGNPDELAAFWDGGTGKYYVVYQGIPYFILDRKEAPPGNTWSPCDKNHSLLVKAIEVSKLPTIRTGKLSDLVTADKPTFVRAPGDRLAIYFWTGQMFPAELRADIVTLQHDGWGLLA